METTTEHLELENVYFCFKARNTAETFIYGRSSLYKLLYSPDGNQFFELDRTGFEGNESRHSVKFEDPHHNVKGEISRNEGTLYWGKKIFKLADTPAEVDYVILPHIRIPEYLFKLADGNLIYVSCDKYHYAYELFKLFIGKPDQMEEIHVNDVQRFRDGGTTYVKTDKGVLYSPTTADPKAKPTWDGEKIKELDPKDFLIEENDNIVKITKKPKAKPQ